MSIPLWKARPIRRRFIAAAGNIQPENLTRGQNPQGITALGRHVDSALRCRGTDKVQVLCAYEFYQFVTELRKTRRHVYSG